MGVMDKFLNYMKLNDEEDEFYDDDDYLDDDEVETPPRKSSASKARVNDGYEDKLPKKAAQPKVTPIRQTMTKKIPVGGMEVCVIKPTSFEEVKEITETLLANRTVVLNLEKVKYELARRIVDFTSGSCYAISGNFQQISNSIFLVTPASVDISGDLQNILGDSFNTPVNDDYL